MYIGEGLCSTGHFPLDYHCTMTLLLSPSMYSVVKRQSNIHMLAWVTLQLVYAEALLVKAALSETQKYNRFA